MHISIKSFGPVLLAVIVAIGSTGAAYAQRQAHPIILTVAFREIGPPPYFEASAWERIKQQLEASDPIIRVRLFPIVPDKDSYYIKLDQMLRSSAATPDIVSEDSMRIGADAAAGYLEPLDRYLAAWPAYGQWYSRMQSVTRFDGRNYGVMNGSDVRLIWYNKNVFRRAGLPAAWQPHSWADILDAARTIKAKAPGVIPLNLYSGTPMGEAAAAQGFEMLLNSTGETLYDDVRGKWVISGKGLLDSLGFVARVYNQSDLLGPPNNIALSASASDQVASQLLPSDNLGIDIDGSWISSSWYPGGAHPWPQWQQVMGYARMPAEFGQTIPAEFGQTIPAVTLSGGWAYAVSARSAHKQEAFALIKAFCARDVLAAYDASIGNIAPRRDAVGNAGYGNAPLRSFFTDLWQHTRFRPAMPAYPAVSLAIDRATESVMSGVRPAGALVDYAAAVTRIAGPDNVERR